MDTLNAFHCFANAMLRPMLTICELIPDGGIGGAQEHLMYLAEHLVQSKYNVIIGLKNEGPYVKGYLDVGATVVPISFSKSIFGIRAIFQCLSIYKKYKPRIIHTHGGVPGLWGRLAAVIFREAVIIHTHHGIHFLHYTNHIKRFLFIVIERILCRFTDVIIFVSPHELCLAQKTRLFSNNKAQIIRNGIDIKRFSNIDRCTGRRYIESTVPPAKGQNIVGVVARLHYQKDHQTLIKAFAMVLSSMPNTVLLLIGDGPLRAELEEQAISLDIAQKVWFLEDRDDIEDILPGLDLFVLPSLWEGLPIALLEAMACKLPIIATDVVGNNDVIENGKDGILVPSKDHAKMAQSIIELLSEKEKAQRYGAAAYIKINKMYAIQSTINKTMAIYKRKTE